MRKLLTILLAAFLIASVAAPPVAAGAAGASGATGASAAQAEATCEYPVELTDATGEDVTLDEPPERVVALQASDAQTVFEIGAEESLVGMPINDFTSHHDAGNRTNVAVEGQQNVDVETVVDLEPDVVLAANVTAPEDVEQLREAGVTVYHFETAEDLTDVRENVQRTGELTGACEGAQERIDWMDERLGALETALEGVERPLAYWSMGGGYTAGNGTFQNAILETAGVENLAAEAGIAGWQEISNEVVIEENPEWIVYGSADPEMEPALSEGAMETTAYEEGNLVAVDSNAVSQPAPHVVTAIETIVEAVHPEAYEEAQAILEEGNGTEGASENATDANGTVANATNGSVGEEPNETADSNETANESTGVGENTTNETGENATDETDADDETENATDGNGTEANATGENATNDTDGAENATDPEESAESDDGDSIPVGIVAAVVAAIAVIAAAVVGFRRL
ncbi:PGF-CTERM-anchored ABC transporter substrate-binding protein [Saliphagus infecundisoli]|uniref:PGF-CTERM-anchored ABC transporter substrate-binding protein n=1 Tax=Saliphagus infecundisoli TaxID=1849069 RepID=A0ABD5Q9Z2_9EURY|nr:PGF-CTERM-anchored ABC transporter substrate-binding protein [Saliphagus infecundisoli]